MSRIFISYSRQDATFARRLAADLSTLGADIWIDVDDIPAGMKWSTAIQQGLKSCEVLIVIISPDSMGSRNVEDEWQYYLDDGKPVIPVLLHPADVHFQLRRIQYIDFHAQEYTAALRELREELARNGVRLAPLPLDSAGAVQAPSAQGPLHPPYSTPVPVSIPASAGIPVKVAAAGAVTLAAVILLIALAVWVIVPALRGDDTGDADRQAAAATETATPTDTPATIPTHTPTVAPTNTARPTLAAETPTATSSPIPSPAPTASGDFFLINPVDRAFRITDRFGSPRDYSQIAPDKIQASEGIGLFATDTNGSPVTVFAAQAGTVLFAGASEGVYGSYVKIEHDWGSDVYVTWYAHLSRIDVEEGDWVNIGDPIGMSGMSGYASGIYLKLMLQHLGAGLDGYIIDDVVDPEPYFDLTWSIDNAASPENLAADPVFPDFFMVNPVDREFEVTSPFDDPRDYSFLGDVVQANEGINLRATDENGDPVDVFAAQNGTVIKVDYATQGYGRYIQIEHRWGDDTYVTWYTHLSATYVEEGDFVVAGQPIGLSGTTGFSTGIHLKLILQHIGAGLDNYVVDDVVDPLPYFDDTLQQQYDVAQFVDDVSIPDGTVIACGTSFTKTWRIRNAGTTIWTPEDYFLVFVNGTQMAEPATQAPFQTNVVPGYTVDVSVEFTAPDTAGTYRSTWRLFNAAGQAISYDLYAEIDVPQDCAQSSTAQSATPFVWPTPPWNDMEQATVVAGLEGYNGSVDNGESLFLSACATCHGPSDGVGPSRTGMGSRAAERVLGLSADEYLYLSIIAPDVYIVDGYTNSMPTDYTARYSLFEILDIVAYLMTQ